MVARLHSEEMDCIAESTSHFIICNNTVLSGCAIPYNLQPRTTDRSGDCRPKISERWCTSSQKHRSGSVKNTKTMRETLLRRGQNGFIRRIVRSWIPDRPAISATKLRLLMRETVEFVVESYSRTVLFNRWTFCMINLFALKNYNVLLRCHLGLDLLFFSSFMPRQYQRSRSVVM